MKWFLARVKVGVEAGDIGWSQRDDIQAIRRPVERRGLACGEMVHVARAANGSDWIAYAWGGMLLRFSKAAACDHLATVREYGRPVAAPTNHAAQLWASHKAGVSMSQAYSGE